MAEHDSTSAGAACLPRAMAQAIDARSWALRERVFKAVDTLVMARILQLPTGNGPRDRFRVIPVTPKIGAYLFTAPSARLREPSQNCYLLKDIVFDQLGAIPTYCMKHCWKIVIKVGRVADLFTLFALMKAHAWPGKCGVDMRSYTFGYYVGFCYFSSREEAEEAFDTRVAAVRDRIPSAQLYLKRSCTEFEMRAPSDTWDEADPFAEAMVQFLSEWVEWEAETHEQTDYVEERVKSLWLERAYAIGDTSIAEVVPNYRAMFPQSVKYREAPAP